MTDVHVLWTAPNMPASADQIEAIAALSPFAPDGVPARLVTGVGRTGRIDRLTSREASAILTALAVVAGPRAEDHRRRPMALVNARA